MPVSAETYLHTSRVLEKSPWDGAFDPLAGVILHEQEMDAAAS